VPGHPMTVVLEEGLGKLSGPAGRRGGSRARRSGLGWGTARGRPAARPGQCRGCGAKLCATWLCSFCWGSAAFVRIPL